MESSRCIICGFLVTLFLHFLMPCGVIVNFWNEKLLFPGDGIEVIFHHDPAEIKFVN